MDTNHEVFWGEIAPCEHLLQFYDHDNVLLDALQGFVAGGIKSDEGVIVIATPEHLDELEGRLEDLGVDVVSALRDDQYIPLDAEKTLKQFMVKDWPDEWLFSAAVTEILQRAKGHGRKVRAFGEMVAILWGKGQAGATVQLEHLWHRLCQRQGFSLFCAYPRIGITKETSQSITEICSAHSRMIGAH